MNAPHIILDRLPFCAKNCQIWWKFDVVITKNNFACFLLRHGVFVFTVAHKCQPSYTEARNTTNCCVVEFCVGILLCCRI